MGKLQLSQEQLQETLQEAIKNPEDTWFEEQVRSILVIGDKKTVVPLKGEIYVIPVEYVPMLYKLLGKQFPLGEYLLPSSLKPKDQKPKKKSR